MSRLFLSFLCRLLFPILFALTPLFVCAQSAEDIERQKNDLAELRVRLETLRRELSASEESRADASLQLKQSEEQISAAQRQINLLKKEQINLQNALGKLKNEERALEKERQRQQRHLEGLLYRQYVQSSPDSISLLLNGESPGQLARDMYYLRVIAQTRATFLSELRLNLRRQKQLTVSMSGKAKELSDVKGRQEEEHARLIAQRGERQQVLTRIAGKIRDQRQQIGTLQKDEKRLNRVIEQITRLLAEQEKKREREKAAAAKNARQDAAKNSVTAKKNLPENIRLPTTLSGKFSTLKGRLRLPARGKISGKYGEAREEGGTWKGIFISAPRGNEVKAVASGQVVHAEWMRGLGNLLIINHGNGYMTVYGYADALYRQVGDRVAGGETVGVTGNSGGHTESGLYFELRHQGATLNPMQWVSLQ
ncbi:MAG: peptidoglycan DD-metalloendopeptidase family protein [Zoogloeaceae bacterium]|jgi:septal ring factor EnvC (AmiA/AmiB activator)|nr:peptidoglycan DD-metalloendopeptidase family protein [Zoogloeaceae bacterium]